MPCQLNNSLIVTSSAMIYYNAFLGCDTTSRIHRIGKTVALKKIIKENLEFIQYAQVFNNPMASTIEVTTAGEKGLLCLYKAGSADTLGSYRYKRFCEKVSANTVHVQLKNIPPTTAAMSYHSMRTYCQVQQWRGNHGIRPECWGWTVTNNSMVPKQTDMPPAPKSLMEAIHCNCKTRLQYHEMWLSEIWFGMYSELRRVPWSQLY